MYIYIYIHTYIHICNLVIGVIVNGDHTNPLHPQKSDSDQSNKLKLAVNKLSVVHLVIF